MADPRTAFERRPRPDAQLAEARLEAKGVRRRKDLYRCCSRRWQALQDAGGWPRQAKSGEWPYIARVTLLDNKSCVLHDALQHHQHTAVAALFARLSTSGRSPCVCSSSAGLVVRPKLTSASRIARISRHRCRTLPEQVHRGPPGRDHPALRSTCRRRIRTRLAQGCGR